MRLKRGSNTCTKHVQLNKNNQSTNACTNIVATILVHGSCTNIVATILVHGSCTNIVATILVHESCRNA